MLMSDILFKTDDHMFSYRVAGVCVRDGKVLLQKPKSDTGYAFVGGHVAFGETGAQTLQREFHEEMGVDISVGALRWMAEIFFTWGDQPCQQICLYYDVAADALPREACWKNRESSSDVEFFWVPLDELDGLELYPPQAKKLLRSPISGVSHFIYRE